MDHSKRSRLLLVGSGLAAGIVVSMLVPSTACVAPDDCIVVYSPGIDWCRSLDNAKKWPIGQPQNSQSILSDLGGPPTGCRCFNNAEQLILGQKIPMAKYEEMIAGIEVATRNTCHLLVEPGFDHNCYIESGPEASTVGIATPDKESVDCIGDCEIIDLGKKGNCPDPDPYECNELYGPGGGGNDEAGETDATDTETTSDTGTDGGLEPELFIDCRETTCEVDADYARMLWSDPSLLLEDDARLVFDPAWDRFVFDFVVSGSVAHQLGLRRGDVLDAVDGVSIEDLDAALQVYSDSKDARFTRVRVLRGSTWIDFTYHYVR